MGLVVVWPVGVERRRGSYDNESIIDLSSRVSFSDSVEYVFPD